MPECDRVTAVGIVDSTLTLARLAPGTGWADADIGAEADVTSFTERTNTAEEFGARVAYDCALRLSQSTTSGDERLALVAWNGRRHAAVIQATDPPSEPYSPDATFQLFIEQPRGEFMIEQFVWAATMEGGESIVVATEDYSIAITAKSWQSQVPRFEDLPVTLDAEQFAIDALRTVGARNVSVAESTPPGYPIGTVQFNTPFALNAFAVIGSVDAFDPMVPLLPDGDSTFHQVGEVEVRLTTGLELEMFDLFESGWRCGDFSWRIYAGLGSPDEVLEFTELLVRSLTC